MLTPFTTKRWDDHFPDSAQQKAINDLEHGHILYFPALSFSLSPEEQLFLNPEFSSPKSKNISYNPIKNYLLGIQGLNKTQHVLLKNLLKRYSNYSFQLIKELLPRYAPHLIMAKTSFRPVEIKGRESSYRKDDKRLHVDAFPSTPNQGQRILRVFSNINPDGRDRIWRAGEDFEDMAKRFLAKAKSPIPGSATLLYLLKITKSKRTLYDHYMLQLHDLMKADEQYQRECKQEELRFPPNTSWIVQTDHVSHAAMQGQHVLEQTFYLPIKAMRNESVSPLRILEKLLKRKLV
jgi:hypothetical protein